MTQEGEEEDIVASGEALRMVAGWLGVSEGEVDGVMEKEGLNPEFEAGRTQGMGLGAKFLPHHKAVALTAGVEHRLGSKLRRSAQGGTAAGVRGHHALLAASHHGRAHPHHAHHSHQQQQESQAGAGGRGGRGGGAGGGPAAGGGQQGGEEEEEDSEEEGGRSRAFSKGKGKAGAGLPRGAFNRSDLLQVSGAGAAAGAGKKRKRKGGGGQGGDGGRGS